MKSIAFAAVAALLALSGCQKEEAVSTGGYSYLGTPDGNWSEAAYLVQDGMAVHEGDILLGTVEEAESLRQAVEGESKSAIGTRLPFSRWRDGVIPYAIESGFPNADRITNAIAHYHEKTALRFVRRTNEFSYLYFAKDKGGCSSFVGRRGGRQKVRLADGCGFGAVVHEIGHAIGLFHEQSRGDRDEHVKIHWDNIEKGASAQFSRHSWIGRDIGPYDFLSIMHYDAYAFSKNAKPTITRLDGKTNLGQREGLSAGDLNALREMYQ